MKKLTSIEEVLDYMIKNIEKLTFVKEEKEEETSTNYDYFYLCHFIESLYHLKISNGSLYYKMEKFLEDNKPSEQQYTKFFEAPAFIPTGNAWWKRGPLPNIDTDRALIKIKIKFLKHIKKEHYGDASE